MKSALERETAQLLVDSVLQDNSLINLRLTKARTNLDKTRSHLQPEEVDDFEDRLLSVEFNIANVSEENQRSGNSQADENARSQFKEATAEPHSVIDELNMLYSDFSDHSKKAESSGLRHRIDKLGVNSEDQDQLSTEIVEIAQAIKKNAMLFQKKLEADNDLVGTATDAIQNTAGRMSVVGKTLQKYRKESQLGWMFYIFSTIFILACLFIGMALIQLFGKW